MNQKNADYLKDSLKYLGFGDRLNTELEKKMKEGQPGFTLRHEVVIGNKQLNSDLHFKKSPQNEMYFFNSYSATKTNGEDLTQDRSQRFYINKNSGITVKEAFNLLEGRAVYKHLTSNEGARYNAWQQLDFSQKDNHGNFKTNQYHDKYGFNLEQSLQAASVKEMASPEVQKMLVYSLQKGNLQQATIEQGGKDVKVFIEASPQFKSINLYDANMQKIERVKDQQQSISQAPKTEKTELKQSAPETKKKLGENTGRDAEDPVTNTPKKTKRKGHSI